MADDATRGQAGRAAPSPQAPNRPATAKPADDDGPIRLDEDDDAPLKVEEDAPTPSIRAQKKRAFGSVTQADALHKTDFQRPMNLTGQGATRCRIFHCKVAPGSLTHMEAEINNWIDGEEIEVKHVGHVVGTMEGKHAEPNVVVMVWY